MAKESKSYSAKDIEVLEGLEPVRKRPAMYIGGTDARGYHHLLWEIVDNAVDEAINGHADAIEVSLDEDGKGATVRDNGRGIPVDMHPKFKRSALELIFCTLHAGGKFGGKNYQVAGGLHGVGSSVVNALSENMSAKIRRDGFEHMQEYARGVPTSKVKRGAATRKTGTEIHFRPDTEIFGTKLKFDADTVAERLDAKAYLHKNLKIIFDRGGKAEKQEFYHAGGIADYLQALIVERKDTAVHPQAFTFEKTNDPRVEMVMQWTESTDEVMRSYANGIPTPQGGTHENGLKQGLAKAVRQVMTTRGMLPKGMNISAEDTREGLIAILSVYVAEPQFQGQTKDKLNNAEVTAQVESTVRTAFEQWLLENPSAAELIINRIIISARAREASRAAAQQVTRKTAVSHRLNLPGKLADCSSTDPEESELFLVEGDSAGGNAKQGRDRKYQAILPLRGKVLNTERASLSNVLANKELQDIVSALGCGVGQAFDINKLRYGKIFLLMDADSDGHHIATLLLTFFYRLLPGLVQAGRIYIAQPPLYRIDAAKQTYWAIDDKERDKLLGGLGKNVKSEISRFKGLGEMTADELKTTTLDPRKRRALRVKIDQVARTEEVITNLMGKDAAPRFNFIMEHAAQADAASLDV